jgi:hypothetical protein
VRRGVKFGAIAGVTIWTVILIGMLGVTLVVPDLRKHGIADLEKDWGQYGSVLAPLRIIGTFAATFALMTMYGIAASTVVMGIAGFLRPGETQSPIITGDQPDAIK